MNKDIYTPEAINKALRSLEKKICCIQSNAYLHVVLEYDEEITISNVASQELLLEGNTELFFDDIRVGNFVSIRITQDDTGGHTVTFPAGTLVSGTLDTTADSTSSITIWNSGGTFLVSIGNYA